MMAPCNDVSSYWYSWYQGIAGWGMSCVGHEQLCQFVRSKSKVTFLLNIDPNLFNRASSQITVSIIWRDALSCCFTCDTKMQWSTGVDIIPVVAAMTAEMYVNTSIHSDTTYVEVMVSKELGNTVPIDQTLWDSPSSPKSEQKHYQRCIMQNKITDVQVITSTVK